MIRINIVKNYVREVSYPWLGHPPTLYPLGPTLTVRPSSATPTALVCVLLPWLVRLEAETLHVSGETALCPTSRLGRVRGF